MAELLAKYQQYDQYKKSGIEWVGDIPSHWEETPVFSCFDATSEKNVDGKETNVLSLSYGNIIKRDVDTNFGLLPESFNTYQIVDVGDIILRLTDLQNDKRSLRVGLAKEKGIITSAYLKLKPKDRLDSVFAYRLLHSYDTTKVYYGLGGGLRQSMKFEDFRRLPILVPPYEEQIQINRFLDYEVVRIDTLIKKQQTLIKLLKEKRQAVISHAVTKGLNPDAPMKDSGVEWLGEVPEHWEVSKLKYLISEPLQYGANEAAEDIDPTQPRFVRITDVLPNGDLKDDTFRSLPKDIAEPYMLKDGDVLLARSGGTVGKSFIYRDSWGKCCFAGYLIKAKIDKNITPAEWFYLNTLTDFYWKWIESIQIQATIQNVSADKYNSFVIAVPPLEESYTIISYIKSNLEVFDTLVMKAEQTIQLMQERRTALISAAVTGKIDVRGWRAPE